jgi:hypothetical protein
MQAVPVEHGPVRVHPAGLDGAVGDPGKEGVDGKEVLVPAGMDIGKDHVVEAARPQDRGPVEGEQGIEEVAGGH